MLTAFRGSWMLFESHLVSLLAGEDCCFVMIYSWKKTKLKLIEVGEWLSTVLTAFRGSWMLFESLLVNLLSRENFVLSQCKFLYKTKLKLNVVGEWLSTVLTAFRGWMLLESLLVSLLECCLNWISFSEPACSWRLLFCHHIFLDKIKLKPNVVGEWLSRHWK